LSDFNETLIFFFFFSKNVQIYIHFIKIRLVGAEFSRADGQTDRQTDKHVEAYSRFLQFCGRTKNANKNKHFPNIPPTPFSPSPSLSPLPTVPIGKLLGTHFFSSLLTMPVCYTNYPPQTHCSQKFSANITSIKQTPRLTPIKNIK
jgi:hypothetical protein